MSNALGADGEPCVRDDGRLVLRYSGTEPLARIMIEGTDPPVVRW